MKTKKSTEFNELNSDFETFRLFHFLKISLEIAIMLILLLVMYGLFCEIFSYDGHGWQGVIAKIFGVAFRLAIVVGVLWLEKSLLIDIVRRYRTGKKKMRNYWKAMFPEVEEGTTQEVRKNRKVLSLRKRASAHKFRTQVSLGMASLLFAYTLMVILCVVMGFGSRVSPDVASMASNSFIIGVVGSVVGGLSWLLHKRACKKVESYE